MYTNNKVSKLLALLVGSSMLLAVAACGNTKGERALSGGAIGAGAGAVGAAILDADPVTGAVVGGAVGAATGALTNKKQINLD